MIDVYILPSKIFSWKHVYIPNSEDGSIPCSKHAYSSLCVPLVKRIKMNIVFGTILLSRHISSPLLPLLIIIFLDKINLKTIYIIFVLFGFLHK